MCSFLSTFFQDIWKKNTLKSNTTVFFYWQKKESLEGARIIFLSLKPWLERFVLGPMSVKCDYKSIQLFLKHTQIIPEKEHSGTQRAVQSPGGH